MKNDWALSSTETKFPSGEFLVRSASISDCCRHRYELRRQWDVTKPILVVCMLNPSTANAITDDPTILALVKFARAWGYGSIMVINLYSIRTSSPKEALSAVDRAPPENFKAWGAAIETAQWQKTPVLVAWGNDGSYEAEDTLFVKAAGEVPLICLGTTNSGAPKHPMARGRHRIPANQEPLPWPR